jgi:hypothetical protein
VRIPGLAAALAQRLVHELPAEIAVSDEPEGYLRLGAGEERWEVFPLDEPEVEPELDPDVYDPPYPAFAVLEALDFVQEFVREHAGVELPEPWAELDGDEIRLGFGDAELDPIRL